ncbi:DUF3078 domain-containing protein [Polluticaenibacter yanchengensis]|uniref:DUF3078 domain-containing protein n=1 Tax=Polluticaenibacter yanchengensis TaxID=3014562 RepID=A0ABT4UN47_9BACT|nr:DUF3078 domain-containing protein [Chitinophagaceae bacterium LY-5]
MKKQLLSLTMMVVTSLCAFSQANPAKLDELRKNRKIEADTSKKDDWKLGGTFAVNFNQQTSSYWVGVTESSSLTLGILGDGYANYAKDKCFWDNALKANYSFLNNQSQGTRKASDFIDVYSKYGYSLNKANTLLGSVIFNGRTQFTNGYDYSVTPRRRTSGFFAPATILLTPGLDWKPKENFSVFVSPAAARWVIVSNDPYSFTGTPGEKPISELYGVDPAKKIDFQFGAFVSVNYKQELFKNVLYTSRLDLYSNYKSNPQNVDIFWTNNIAFKVNSWLAFTYQFNIAYDDDFRPEGKVGPRTQFLGNLGIGVTTKF